MTTPASDPISSKPPVPVRFLRWLFSWRMMGRGLAALAALVTLIALLYAEEDWRGNRAWTHYKSDLEAKGEKLEWNDYIPAPVADDQNFAMTPFLAPLLDFNPRPLQPGQTIWRDTNGYNRAVNFGKGIEPLAGLGGWDKGRMSDLPGALIQAEQEPDKAIRPSRATVGRAEAAAEILRVLETKTPVLDELRAASHRPSARFNLPYSTSFLPTILLPHLAVLKGIDRTFQARALAELELGQIDAALSDTETALYLPETIKDEPFLICDLVRIAMFQVAVQPIWEGLARHKWSEPQLAELAERLGKMSFLAPGTLRGERAFSLRTIEQWRTGQNLESVGDSGVMEDYVNTFRFVPDGWLALNQLDIARLCQEVVLPAIDSVSQRVYPTRATVSDAMVAEKLRGGFSPFRMMAKMLVPALSKAMMRIAIAQNALNMARVACALERFRLANGQFPETLAALSPRFLATIPHDIIGGEPLKYRRLPDGQFILYSVGWNEKDDGGTVVMNQGTTPSVDVTRGDWVWQYPAK